MFHCRTGLAYALRIADVCRDVDVVRGTGLPGDCLNLLLFLADLVSHQRNKRASSQAAASARPIATSEAAQTPRPPPSPVASSTAPLRSPTPGTSAAARSPAPLRGARTPERPGVDASLGQVVPPELQRAAAFVDTLADQLQGGLLEPGGRQQGYVLQSLALPLALPQPARRRVASD